MPVTVPLAVTEMSVLEATFKAKMPRAVAPLPVISPLVVMVREPPGAEFCMDRTNEAAFVLVRDEALTSV